ncbi:MAG TPA: ABA4-like family protein [Alphaproteobacteria bacterium]|nr:ABA4-like family protein [Alphaproteobacteria bacterium]
MPVSPASLFGLGNMVALAGWALLASGIAFRSTLLKAVGGLWVPIALCTLYTALIGAYWSSAEGGFSSLDGVAALFRSPWMLLAGWLHYLAFDLFIGAWIAADAEARGLHRALLIPVLPAVFLFGPAGLLLWIGLRAAFAPAAATS